MCIRDRVVPEDPVEELDVDVVPVAVPPPVEETPEPVEEPPPPPVEAAAAPAPAPAPPAVVEEEEGSATPADPWGTNVEEAPSEGMLTINTTPPGARVMLGAENLGASPVRTTVAYGAHTITVEMDGYRTEVRNVSVNAQQLSVPFELLPVLSQGTVQITGREGSMILVDGAQAGTSPTTLQLAPGLHTFRILSEDGTSYTVTRDVQFESANTPFVINLPDAAP